MAKKKVKKESKENDIIQCYASDETSIWFDLIRTGIKCTLSRGSSGLKFELSTETDLEAIALENLLGGKDRISNGKHIFEVDYISTTRDLPGVRGITFKVASNG